ncbi:MAG TPA: hypothetical protein VIK18_12540, partial [Pirellulales bacterium]
MHDLAAAREGNRITLAWTAPQRTTDRLRIEAPVRFRICRQLSAAHCANVGARTAAPSKPGRYTDNLPATLASGPLRQIVYEVFGLNRHGRTAGPSNPAAALAGAAPPPVENLTAVEVERGVVLHWRAMAAPQPGTWIELRRTLLTPPPANHRSGQGLPVATEPAQQILRVPASSHPGTAIDTAVEFDRKYSYVAVRIAAVTADGKRLRADSAAGNPVV